MPDRLKSTLIVPVALRGLAVNKDFEGKDIRRWRMNFFQLLRHRDPEPLPFHGEIEDRVFDKPEKWGVYLHWTLPLALRRGRQHEGELLFPALPNRWLVLRAWQDAQNQWQSAWWSIHSDALSVENPGGSTFSYVDAAKNIQVSKLGKSSKVSGVPDETSVLKPEKATFKRLNLSFPKTLNALGYGDVHFLAYQPLINDVFSFHDALDDLRDEDGNPRNVPLHYFLAGWYSDASEEALKADDVVARLKDFNWEVEADDARKKELKRSLYYGQLYEVNVPGARPEDADNKPLKVTIGHNAIDAMLALLAAADVGKEPLALLKAFKYGALSRLEEPGSKTLLAQEIHKSWFHTRSGGIFWTLEWKDPEAETVSAEHKPPPDDALKALDELNTLQKTYDQKDRELKNVQKLLYDAWWRLISQFHSYPEDSKEARATLQKAIDGLPQTDLGEQIANLQVTQDAAQSEIEQKLKDLTGLINGHPYELKNRERGAFYEPADPTVLLTGIAPPPQETEQIECLLAEQLKFDATYQGPPLPAEGLLSALMKDFAHHIKAPPTRWKQPWQPLFFEWEAEWFPLPFVHHEAEKVWTFNGFDHGFNLDYEQIVEKGLYRQRGVAIQGRNFLMPQNNMMLKRQVDELIHSMPQAERGKWDGLKNAVKEIIKHGFFSQSLKDFNRMLLMQHPQLSLLPEGKLKELIGEETRSQPFTPSGQRPEAEGIRQGQFKINKLIVYDGFGQCVTVVGGRGGRHERYFRPYTDSHLRPGKGTVIAWNKERFMELKPRLQAFARLQFDFTDTGDDQRVTGIHHDANPIRGWVIHNHLDKGLAYFDPAGEPAGETRITHGTVQHNDLGNPDQVFREFIKEIPKDKDDFEAFLTLIDRTLWTIAPNANLQDRHLAVWMGRPLVLVRARLRFEGYEPEGQPTAVFAGRGPHLIPKTEDPVWLKKQQQGFRRYEYPVFPGLQGARNDGLIGVLWNKKFYAVHKPGQQLQGSTFIEHLKPNSFRLKFGEHLDLTFLIDPGAGVHARTGLLPFAGLDLPAEFVNQALEKIQVRFRFPSLLTPVEKAAENKGRDIVYLPFPALQKGAWHWEEKHGGRVVPFEVRDVPGAPALPTQPALIRDGNLVLSDALDDATEPDSQAPAKDDSS